jgi:Zn-finger nucleic acid-binding protein
MGRAMAALTCPKCEASMRTYERSGVHVDQCVECRGVFLDRGELERLINAEAAFDDPTTPVAGYDAHRGRPTKRKRGFLSDLFDD